VTKERTFWKKEKKKRKSRTGILNPPWIVGWDLVSGLDLCVGVLKITGLNPQIGSFKKGLQIFTFPLFFLADLDSKVSRPHPAPWVQWRQQHPKLTKYLITGLLCAGLVHLHEQLQGNRRTGEKITRTNNNTHTSFNPSTAEVAIMRFLGSAPKSHLCDQTRKGGAKWLACLT
jgi:hypothetical protein